MTMSAMFGLLALSSVALCATASANTFPVSITVSGLQKTGKIFGAVFADANSFKAKDNAVLRFSLDPHGGAISRTTITLQAGRYAVALFQDTKGTGKLESNFFGVPTVPYGFSNNASGGLRAPGFDAAAFDVGGADAGSGPKSLSIELH